MTDPKWQWPVMPCMRQWAIERGLIPVITQSPDDDEETAEE